MKGFIKIVGVSAGALGLYLAINHKSPQQFLADTKTLVTQKTQQFQQLHHDWQQFNASLAKFKSEVQKSQKTLQAIQTRLDEYQFEIQPHLTKINEALDRLK